MREIKFRGIRKRLDREVYEWVYGEMYHTTEDGDVCIQWWEDGYYKKVEVWKDTVGQFTGLKDKNGKEIYEGDIIACGPKRYVCEFVEGGFEFRDLSDGELILKAIAIHSQVVGNKHEIQELRL